MFARFGVSVSLAQTEIDYVDDVLRLLRADKEVIRLNVSVDEVIIVQKLYPLEDLVSNQQHGLEGEAPFAESEEVLQALPEQIDDHDVVVTF